MKLKPSNLGDVTTKINDTFWYLQHETFIDDELFEDKLTAFRFKLTTDFIIHAAAHKIDDLLSVRFNTQFGVAKGFKVENYLN